MIPPDKMGDRKAIAAAVEAMEPIWTPGTANGYHAATFGWVLDELVYRWEGRNISRFMDEEVIKPLGLKNIFIGLPPQEFPRMAKMFVQGGVRGTTGYPGPFQRFSEHTGRHEPSPGLGGWGVQGQGPGLPDEYPGL